jgi:hypothetical protein
VRIAPHLAVPAAAPTLIVVNVPGVRLETGRYSKVRQLILAMTKRLAAHVAYVALSL